MSAQTPREAEAGGLGDIARSLELDALDVEDGKASPDDTRTSLVRDLKNIVVMLRAHRCAPPAPEVVSGAEAAPRVHVVDANRSDTAAYLRAVSPAGTARSWAEADLVVDRTGRVLKWRGWVAPAPEDEETLPVDPERNAA